MPDTITYTGPAYDDDLHANVELDGTYTIEDEVRMDRSCGVLESYVIVEYATGRFASITEREFDAYASERRDDLRLQEAGL